MGKAAGLIPAGILLLSLGSCLSLRAEIDLPDSIPRLPTVHVRARGAGVHVLLDTVEYSASAYRGPEVRKVQDLLAKLEGFSVSPDGHVFVNGQEIETILVNGEELTGTNYRLLSRYLRAGLVKKVQLIRNYEPDPLLHELRSSRKIGLSLVLHDSLTQSLSGGIDLGASARGRKDMDMHLLDLRGRNRMIGLGSWNGTGMTATNNRDFYARDDDPDPVHPGSSERSSPVHVGLIPSPALPEGYVRDNDDRSLSMVWKRKLAAGRRMGMVLGLDRETLVREADKASHYDLQDGSDWSTRERERTGELRTGILLRSEYGADRGRKGSTRFWSDMHAGKEDAVHENEVSGAITEKLKELDRMSALTIRAHLRDSRRLGNAAVMVTADLSWLRERQVFRAAGRRMYPAVADSGLGMLDQRWQCEEWREDLLVKYVPPKGSRSSGWALHYEGHEGMRAGYRTYPLAQGSTGFTRRSVVIETEGERKAGRNASWQWSISAGAGAWRFGTPASWRHSSLHDVLLGYERRTGPFRAWGFSYRDIHALPSEKYVLPMEMATGSYAMVLPQMEWKPSRAHQLSFRYSARSLAAGTGMMFLVRYTLREHEVLQGLMMRPGLTRIMPMPSGRGHDLQANLGGDLFILPIRLKWNVDLHLTAARSRALVNDLWSDRLMRNGGFGSRISSSWRTVLNVDVSWACDNSWYRDMTDAGEQISSTWSNTVRVKLRARWSDHWYAACTGEWSSMPGLPSFLAVDGHLSWQCHERLQFSVTAHDLLQEKQAVTRWVQVGAEGVTVFRVVPSYLLWKLSWAI